MKYIYAYIVLLLLSFFLLTSCGFKIDIPNTTHKVVHTIELPTELLDICNQLPEIEDRAACTEEAVQLYFDLLKSLKEKAEEGQGES